MSLISAGSISLDSTFNVARSVHIAAETKLIANSVQKLVVVVFAQPVQCRLIINQSEAASVSCMPIGAKLTDHPLHMHAHKVSKRTPTADANCRTREYYEKIQEWPLLISQLTRVLSERLPSSKSEFKTSFTPYSKYFSKEDTFYHGREWRVPERILHVLPPYQHQENPGRGDIPGTATDQGEAEGGNLRVHCKKGKAFSHSQPGCH
jgi:hypothetical protein